MADPADGTSMLSITIGNGHASDAPVLHMGWVIPRDMAEDLIEKLTGEMGPPRVESLGTVGGAVDSYERSQREGMAIYLDPGRADG
jgi:hypothetical protein